MLASNVTKLTIWRRNSLRCLIIPVEPAGFPCIIPALERWDLGWNSPNYDSDKAHNCEMNPHDYWTNVLQVCTDCTHTLVLNPNRLLLVWPRVGDKHVLCGLITSCYTVCRYSSFFKLPHAMTCSWHPVKLQCSKSIFASFMYEDHRYSLPQRFIKILQSYPKW